MDDMSDFVARYLSQTDSSVSDYRIQQQAESVFSPDFCDMPDSDSSAKMNEFNNTFCHKKNLDQCLIYLDQELTLYGQPSLFEHGSQHFDPVKLVNCMYSFLQQYQHTKHMNEELEDRIHRLESDLACCKQREQNLVRQLNQSQQETAQAREQERQITVKNKILTAKLKSEKEEVRRLRSVLHHTDVQYKHELKKKEREHNKLKERLHKMLTDKKGVKTGMTISSVLQRPGGSRGTWSGLKQEEELFRSVISNYEAKTKELMVENSGLRKCLMEIQSELLADNNSSSDEKSLTNVSMDDLVQDQRETDNITDGPDSAVSAVQCQLPLEFLEESLLKSINDRCRHLKKYIRNLEKQKSEGLKFVEKPLSPSNGDNKNTQDIDKLVKDIKRYKEIIEQQEQFIQDTLANKNTDSVVSFLNESELEEEKENLAVQKKLFEEQRANFWKERHAFTEAAIRLHKEKKKFEDAKALFLKDQFLQITPFNKSHREGTGKSSSVSSEPPMSESSAQDVPVSPMNERCDTPESQKLGHATTPTTVDLYQLLGINNKKKEKENRPKSADPNVGATPSGFLSKRNCSPSWASSGSRRCTSAINHTRTPQQRLQDTTMSRASNIKMLLFQHRNRVLDVSDGEETDQ